MLSRIQSLGSCLIVLTLLLFADSAGAQDVSPRCEAAMDRAAGHYSKCLLSADASYARHENATKLANRQTRCETRFDRRTTRAITRHGADACPSSDLVAAMEDRTVTYAEGVATEASGTPAPSFLFVQNGTGGTLSETTVTLTGVSSQTGWFTDRPYREAGQIPTEEFIGLWDEGKAFAEDPPNADFTCTVDSEVVNYVRGCDLAQYGGSRSLLRRHARGYPFVLNGTITCEGDSHLFVDGSGGCDLTTNRWTAEGEFCCPIHPQPTNQPVGCSCTLGTFNACAPGLLCVAGDPGGAYPFCCSVCDTDDDGMELTMQVITAVSSLTGTNSTPTAMDPGTPATPVRRTRTMISMATESAAMSTTAPPRPMRIRSIRTTTGRATPATTKKIPTETDGWCLSMVRLTIN